MGLAAAVAAGLVVCGAAGAAWAQHVPPRHPPGVERVDVVDWVALPGGGQVGAVVYRKRESLGGKQTREFVYVEVHRLQGGGVSEVARLRLGLAFADGYRFALRPEAVRTSDAVVVLDVQPTTDEGDRDTFKAMLAVGRGTFDVIWSGTLDPVASRDRVVLREINGVREVVLADVNNRVVFCGTGLAELLPRVWDFKRGAFVSAPLNTSRADAATRIEARLDAEAPITSHFADLATFKSASSDLRDTRSGPGGRISRPVDLGDGSPATAWVEGVAGWGIGEFVTAELNPAFPLRGLRLIPGMARDEASFSSHASPAELLLTFQDGTLYRVSVPRPTLAEIRETGGIYIPLPEPVTSDCLSVTLLSVHEPRVKARATRADDGRYTAISEVTPLSELDFEPRQEALRRLIEAMVGEARGRRFRELTRLAKGLGTQLKGPVQEALRAELNKPAGQCQAGRLVPLIVQLPPGDAIELTRELLASSSIASADVAAVQRAISLDAEHLVPPLIELALAPGTEELARERIVHILGRAATPEQLIALVPLLGRGSLTLRKDVVRALSRVSVKAADPILGEVASHPGQPAAHDGLWALDRITRRAFRGKPGTLPGAERVLKAYSDTEDLQIRIRALRLLNRLTLTNGDVFLATVLTSRERDELRAMAAEALANYPSDKSTDALIAALGDRSPSVRFAAIEALQTRPSVPRVVDAALDYARREDWARGQEQAYTLLATSNQRAAPDYLYQIIEAADPKRALLALSALKRARANVRTLPLSRVIEDEERPHLLREEAVRVLAWTQDAESEQILIGLLLDADLDLDLRRAAAFAFQHRQSPGAFKALATAAQELDPPELQVAVIRTLAYYISADSLKVLRGLKGKVPPRTERYIDQSISIIESRQSFDAFKNKILQ